MLQPAFYRKRKRIAMYAAANITILIEYCALAGNSHVGTGLPLKDMSDNDRGPL